MDKPSSPPVGDLLGLNEFQSIARKTVQTPQRGFDGLSFFLLGLFGEVGTLLSALKKKQREKDAYVGYSEAVREEFGDVIWYFSNIASLANLNLSVLAQRMSRSLSDWDEVGNDNFGSFGDLQSAKDASGSPNSAAFEAALISLAGKVGLLLDDFGLGKIKDNRDVLSAHLVDIFRALISAADVADIDLQEAVVQNVRKIHSRWPENRIYAPLFDDEFGPLEQFPRRFEIHIFESFRNGKSFVVQQYNGINIGNPLTDNKLDDDDYRFHDVFHIAYAAILGWSPVIRALLKLKRKSKPKIDDAEDGARAIIIEEGISTLIFSRGIHLNHFASMKSLDYDLLKTIPPFVHGFEVQRCPLWQWEKAILDGYSAFRKLRIARRGIITADLNNRSITFSELP